uniref:Uncharacterized protein n=1 Tax=Zea mays TaxID=4577 RepID=B6TSK3_MAIZE|nr:hypothetical protein [Zea mays]
MNNGLCLIDDRSVDRSSSMRRTAMDVRIIYILC